MEPRRTYPSCRASWRDLDCAAGELVIHVHGEVLIQDYCGVPRTKLHFAVGPGRESGELLNKRDDAVIQGAFFEPATGPFHVRGQPVAKALEIAEGPRPDAASSMPVEKCSDSDIREPLIAVNYR